MVSFSKALVATLVAAAPVAAFVAPHGKFGVTSTSLASTSVSDLPADTKLSKNIWRSLTPTVVQGQSLRTFQAPAADRVQVLLKTEGRPLNSRVELWQGPDYLPFKLGIYLEDGNLSPFNAVVETPYDSNTVAVYNTGNLEFPLKASIVADQDNDLADIKGRLTTQADANIIQGGALRTYPFDASVASVQVMLQTDGRHLQARIELLQGPNNNKQIIQVYSSDGKKRPFYAVFETPEAGCVVRIVNEQTVEYPLQAWVEPYKIDEGYSPTEPVIGGDSGRY